MRERLFVQGGGRLSVLFNLLVKVAVDRLRGNAGELREIADNPLRCSATPCAQLRFRLRPGRACSAHGGLQFDLPCPPKGLGRRDLLATRLNLAGGQLRARRVQSACDLLHVGHGRLFGLIPHGGSDRLSPLPTRRQRALLPSLLHRVL